jgi:RimJ/RimL family protein N-acetyltransferase
VFFKHAYSALQINTGRLLLRPYRSSDARALFEFVAHNRERMRNYLPMTVEQNTSVLAARRFIRERKSEYLNDKSCFLGIFLPSGQLIGQIAIREINYRVPKCEMGYVVDERHTDKGYAREALHALCHWCFAELKMQKVSLRIEPVNTASRKVAVAAGFTLTALLRNDFRTADARLMDAELWECLAPTC